MAIDLHEVLVGNQTLLTFLVIGVGYLIAGLKVGKIPLGSTAGVLIAGLGFGHFGFAGNPSVGTIGFTLFIFSVGLQAGPRFFSVFLTDGAKYISLAAVVATTALGVTLALTNMLELDYGINAGLLAGALTSTPTLAGAQDAIDKGLAALPAGMAAAEAVERVSIGYAITYLFGTIGLILFIRLFPVALGIDLPAEAKKLARERGFDDDAKDAGGEQPVIRAYAVSPEIVDTTVGDVGKRQDYRLVLQRIRRGDDLLDPTSEIVLQAGDIVSVIASLADHKLIQERLGGEVLDSALINYRIETREIVVIRPDVSGRTLGELHLPREFGCFPTGLVRAAIDLPLGDDVALERGDRLVVTGERSRLDLLATRLGHVEEDVEKTDLLTFSFGIVAGLFIGTILVKVGELSIGLGSAGGLLLMGIVIGFLRSVNPTFGRVPAAARFVFMELGLMMFMAGVGLNAGGGIVEALGDVGPELIVAGVAVTLTPVMVGYLFGHFVLKLNPALLLGALTGAMTSTPALNIITDAAKSPVPALGYAGTYTFANVFLTFAGTLIVSL